MSLLTDEALRPYVYVCLISDDGHVGGADHQRQHPHAEDGQQTLPGRHAGAQRVQDAHVPDTRQNYNMPFPFKLAFIMLALEQYHDPNYNCTHIKGKVNYILSLEVFGN